MYMSSSKTRRLKVDASSPAPSVYASPPFPPSTLLYSLSTSDDSTLVLSPAPWFISIPPSPTSSTQAPFSYESPPYRYDQTPPSPGSSQIPLEVVVGISVGISVAIVVILLFVILIVFGCKKKKKRYDPEGTLVFQLAAPNPKGNYYYGGGQPQPWQQYFAAPPPLNVVEPVRPKPSPPPSRPPPAPPFTSSSGSSGSGSEVVLPPPSPGIGLSFSQKQSSFTFEELARATDGFSDANLLGQGGFGFVHKGVLPNGKEVAVKQLKAGSGQGEREFQAEVEIISRVHHKHLVSLVGYCITGSHRLLVYEFVPNKTLEFHLHGKGRPTMDWPSRLRIAYGSAKGLAYLHEDCHPKIIHRDIKAANILLDFKFGAMVADFGLAKLDFDGNTHISTRIMGTFGYLAPEYASSGKLTDKSDVFSFGVMLLELITGRLPVNSKSTYMDDCLVDWARPLLTRALVEQKFDDLVDPKLQSSYNQNEMARMIACAAACVRHSAWRRPRMSQIVRALEGESSLSDLNEGIRPGDSTANNSSQKSSDYNTSQYKDDMIKFRKMALGSQECGARSGYNALTSKYGINLSMSGVKAKALRTWRWVNSKIKKSSSQGGFVGDS